MDESEGWRESKLELTMDSSCPISVLERLTPTPMVPDDISLCRCYWPDALVPPDDDDDDDADADCDAS